MSWTTVVDLPMERYEDSQVVDHTDFANHANMSAGITANPGYTTLNGGDDQLEIPAAVESLQRFSGLRIEAAIRPTSLPHRLNLVEGWMAFALIIEANGTLAGTIYDGQTWVGVISTQTVPMNHWSRVQFDYDGISIGRLHLNGSVVGTRLDMPMGMRQPHQVITLGHWPRGDARYTFHGDLGHVRIDRRDHEDAWRDALAGMLCQHPLASRQAAAMTELLLLVRSIDPRAMAELVACIKERHERMGALVRRVRRGNARTIATYRQLGRQLRAAWCCGEGLSSAKRELLDGLTEIAGDPGSEEYNEYSRNVEELLDIGAMCQPAGPPFDRMRELMLVLLPELATADRQFRDLVAAVEEG
jgi:hypothetical protein